MSISVRSKPPGKNNIVSAYACAKGEIRCYDRELMKQTLQEIEKICKECSVPGVQVGFKYTAGRLPMYRAKGRNGCMKQRRNVLKNMDLC